MKNIIILVTFVFLLIPILARAQGDTTPVPTTYGSYDTSKGLVICGNEGQNPCTFDDLYKLVNAIKDFALLYLMVPLAIVSFAFAGFKYVAAQGSASEITKAHEIFYYTVGGIVLALGAWLIVATILSVLGVKDAYNFLK